MYTPLSSRSVPFTEAAKSQITEAVKAYAERNQNAHSATPYIATAKIYNPTGRDFLWNFPTMKQSFKPYNAPRRTVDNARVEILAMDLKESIPGLVGE